MPLTLNQIFAKARQIAGAHLQINDFYRGIPSESEDDGPKLFPMCCFDTRPGSTLSVRTDKVRFIAAFADILNTDKSNEEEVLSDQKRIAHDFYAQFYEYLEANGIELEADAPLTDFREKWGSDVAGWLMELTINQVFTRDTCQVPSTFDPAEDEGSVLIYENTTLETLYRLNPGQSLGILRFSGINDTGPPYTNSLIDNG